MKTKSILALLLAMIMCVSMFALTSCGGDEDKDKTSKDDVSASSESSDAESSEDVKELTPAEKLMTALSAPGIDAGSDELLGIFDKVSSGFAVDMNLTVESTGSPEDMGVVAPENLKFDLSTYFTKDGTFESAVVDVVMDEQKYNVELLINDTTIVLGGQLLGDKYGIDLEEIKDKFSTSIFGTKGQNIFGITEGEENELVSTIESLLEGMKTETEAGTITEEELETLITNSITISEELDKTYTIDGESVDCTFINVCMTTAQLKALILEFVEKSGIDMEALLSDITTVAPTPGTEDVSLEVPTIEDVIAEMFEGYADDDEIIVCKFILKPETNGLMGYELTVQGPEGEDPMVMILTLGKDPENINKITATIKEGEEVVDTLVADIKETEDSTVITIVDTEGDGLQISHDKKESTVTFVNLEDNEPTDDKIVFHVEIKEDQFTLSTSVVDEYSKGSISVTFRANAKSPVTANDFIDILTMTEEQMQALITKLSEIMPTPDEPSLDIDDNDIVVGI